MNTDKLLGIKLRDEATDGFPQEVRLLAAVYRHIIAFRFDPINFISTQKVNSAARLDDQPFQIWLTSFQIIEQTQNSPVYVTSISIVQNLRFCALPARIEALPVEWF